MRVPARGAGVDTMMLLKMSGDLPVLDRDMHCAVTPVTWVHSNLGVMVAQDIPVNQDGIHPMILLEHIMDHEIFRRAICVHIRSVELSGSVEESLSCF